MTFFFFVIGLEARREFDLGELRERRRVALPLSPGSAGWSCRSRSISRSTPGHDSAHGWGTAMSTDTAFALGLLALVGPGLPDRLRAFLLTVAVVDDIVALLVIAIVYSGRSPSSRFWSRSACSAHPRSPRRGVHFGAVYFLLGTAVWVALLRVRRRPGGRRDCIGLLALRTPPSASDLERASDLFRALPGAADRRARAHGSGQRCGRPSRRTSGCSTLWHPWTSYAIVPLFALANAGVAPQRRLPFDGVLVPA